MTDIYHFSEPQLLLFVLVLVRMSAFIVDVAGIRCRERSPRRSKFCFR